MSDTNKTNETVITPRAENAVMDWPINRHVYKAVIEYEVRGETERITLFTQAPGFELAKTIIAGTDYMRKEHGRFVSLAEVAGLWVE